MGDRERWDGKYSAAEGRREAPADPFVVRAVASLGPPRGRRALDLAAGTGRHALHLAAAGWETSAWDVSPVGLELLSRRATEQGLTVTTRAIDLLAAAPPAERGFDLVCVVDFFDADLWSRLGDLLAAGGSLVARSFTRDWPGDRPPARYRLAPGALAAGLPGLTSVWHEEAGGRSGLLARRPE